MITWTSINAHAGSHPLKMRPDGSLSDDSDASETRVRTRRVNPRLENPRPSPAKPGSLTNAGERALEESCMATVEMFESRDVDGLSGALSPPLSPLRNNAARPACTTEAGDVVRYVSD